MKRRLFVLVTIEKSHIFLSRLFFFVLLKLIKIRFCVEN